MNKTPEKINLQQQMNNFNNNLSENPIRIINIMFSYRQKRNILIVSQNEKLSIVFEKYRNKFLNEPNLIFLYNSKRLNLELTVSESGIQDFALIYVINPNPISLIGPGNINFNYRIKNNKFIELIPQMTIYFPHIEENKAQQLIQKGEIESLKKELIKILGDDFEITENNLILGSILLKVNIFFKKLLSKGKIKQINDFFNERSKEVQIIKEAIKCIKKKVFNVLKI